MLSFLCAPCQPLHASHEGHGRKSVYLLFLHILILVKLRDVAHTLCLADWPSYVANCRCDTCILLNPTVWPSSTAFVNLRFFKAFCHYWCSILPAHSQKLVLFMINPTLFSQQMQSKYFVPTNSLTLWVPYLKSVYSHLNIALLV